MSSVLEAGCRAENCISKCGVDGSFASSTVGADEVKGLVFGPTSSQAQILRDDSM